MVFLFGLAVAHCGSSRQIISHYSSCTNAQCPICAPLRRQGNIAPGGLPLSAAQQPQPLQMPKPGADAPWANHPLQQPQQPQLQRQPGQMPTQEQYAPQLLPPQQPGFAGASGEDVKPVVSGWGVNPDQTHRAKLVQKLIEALSECMDPAEQARRGEGITELARKIEDSVFRTATRQEEYYHLLAEKIYKLKKAQEMRRAGLDAANSGALGGGSTGAVPVVPIVPPPPNRLQLDQQQHMQQQQQQQQQQMMMMPGSGAAGVSGARPGMAGGARRVKSYDNGELQHTLKPVLEKLKRHPDAEPFARPVDYVSLNILVRLPVCAK
jgi:E1A/CREB-binding protein